MKNGKTRKTSSDGSPAKNRKTPATDTNLRPPKNGMTPVTDTNLRPPKNGMTPVTDTKTSKQPWYYDGLRFECAQCGGCCTGAPGYVWVNKSEIEAMATAVHLDVDEFERRYVRRVGMRKSLIERANGDCVFFHGESRTCQFYSARPRQCRTWPFWASNLASPAAWQQMCDRCPGGDRGPLVPIGKIHAQMGVINV